MCLTTLVKPFSVIYRPRPLLRYVLSLSFEVRSSWSMSRVRLTLLLVTWISFPERDQCHVLWDYTGIFLEVLVQHHNVHEGTHTWVATWLGFSGWILGEFNFIINYFSFSSCTISREWHQGRVKGGENLIESVSVGWLTANMQHEAGSLSTLPLAAQRPMVAMLWQSLRTGSAKNVPY